MVRYAKRTRRVSVPAICLAITLWQGFLSRVSSVEGGASTTLELRFAGRHQSRTVVQIVLSPATESAKAVEIDGSECYVFELQGEILRGGEVFDQFQYRYQLPVSEITGSRIPLVAERSLRSGAYRLKVGLIDAAGERIFETEERIEVPVTSDLRADRAWSAPADSAMGSGDSLVRIVPPPDRLLTDRYRVEAEVQGENVAKVRFILNGKTVMTKIRPPYSVEVDLGKTPRLHALAVEALDSDGEILARDRTTLNGGPHRFAIRLLEPHSGKRYEGSVHAVAEVDLPTGERLDRVEFFLNEARIARLHEAPWAQTIPLPENQRITYLRALAVLDDGNSSEDTVFINAPDDLDRLRVDFVELFVGVHNRRGEVVDGLEGRDFEVFEEGVQQRIARFEFVRDLPVYAGLVLDTSTSMSEELEALMAAASRFFDKVIRSKDRAAVMVFDDSMQIRVPLTNDTRILTDALEGLESRGDTTLYDSLIESLFYFAGLDGKRALILISDGSDSASRYTFAEALEYAQRSGAAIYPIILGMSPRDRMVRGRMLRLAGETGGRAYFVTGVEGIDRVYAEIETDLRSQYLLAYQSTSRSSAGFRSIEVRVLRTGLKATTVPGYYP